MEWGPAVHDGQQRDGGGDSWDGRCKHLCRFNDADGCPGEKAEFLEYARTQAGSKAFRRKHRKDRRECADACGLSRSDRESGI